MLPGRSASVVGGQQHDGLAIGQAELLIQFRGQRHRAGPDLPGGSATGIRGLAGMAALHRPPALLATTDLHAEAKTLYTRLWDVRSISCFNRSISCSRRAIFSASVSSPTFQHVRPQPAGKDNQAKGSVTLNKCIQSSRRFQGGNRSRRGGQHAAS
jgi:hypothetical protein